LEKVHKKSRKKQLKTTDTGLSYFCSLQSVIDIRRFYPVPAVKEGIVGVSAQLS
jgi:hypothetical protein